MRALRLAINLIRIPRLFGALLLWPLCIGIFVALAQVTMSASYIALKNVPAATYKARSHNVERGGFIRQYLYGTQAPLAPVRLCKWTSTVPPSPDCELRRVDAVVRGVSDKQLTQYLEFLNGSVEKVHHCEHCESDLQFTGDSTKPTTHMRSINGLLLLFHAQYNAERTLNKYYANAKIHVQEIKELQGDIFFSPGDNGITLNTTSAGSLIVLITNVAFLIIITLWLALRAHRKVLDYFATNDCLLPLVAACGKNNFYLAIWIVTTLRVAFFLLATIPITISFFIVAVPADVKAAFIRSPYEFILWLFAIAASLGVTVVIASIGELKQRHLYLGFLYRYVPLFLCLAGGTLWSAGLLQMIPAAHAVVNIVVAIPIIGLLPVIIEPMIDVSNTALAVHSVLSLLLATIMLRLNAKWFAAHLEEL